MVGFIVRRSKVNTLEILQKEVPESETGKGPPVNGSNNNKTNLQQSE